MIVFWNQKKANAPSQVLIGRNFTAYQLSARLVIASERNNQRLFIGMNINRIGLR